MSSNAICVSNQWPARVCAEVAEHPIADGTQQPGICHFGHSTRDVEAVVLVGRTATFVITNVSGSAKTFSVSVSDTAADGANFSLSGTGSLNLGAGASGTVTVSVDTTRGAADGFKQAQLNVSSSGSQIAHAMLLILVGEADAAPGQHMVPVPSPKGCGFEGSHNGRAVARPPVPFCLHSSGAS